MALINCPECTKEISSAAPACLNCGFPIATARDVEAVGTPLTTIQETSKNLKGHVILSIFMVVGGFFWMMASDSSGVGPGLTMFGGAAYYLIARLQIWWHHG